MSDTTSMTSAETPATTGPEASETETSTEETPTTEVVESTETAPEAEAPVEQPAAEETTETTDVDETPDSEVEEEPEGDTFDKAYVEKLRRENAKQRTAAKSAQEATTAAQRELAIFKAAAGAGVNAEALTDSRAFMNTVEGLDPSAADFTEKVTAAITAAVEKNNALKTTQVVGKGGAEHAGGSGEGAITQEAFNRMGLSEKNALFHSDPVTYRRLAG